MMPHHQHYALLAAAVVVSSCGRKSPTSVLPIIAGLLVGVAIGRASNVGSNKNKIRSLRQQEEASNGNEHDDNAPPTAPREELFNAEGWEGDADVSDWEPFRLIGRSMIDYVVNYYQEIESLPVRPRVEPGYLRQRLTQAEFPLEGEKWSAIMADVESHIMPGITHWQHPSFFAWYPGNSSPPAILGDLLANMFNVVGFSWEASPAATELETIVLDQLAHAMGLPEVFLSTGEGGGVIQGSASEGTLVGLLAARKRALKHMRLDSPGTADHELLARMTLYASDQAHSSVQKAANIAGLGDNLRLIPTWASDDCHGHGPAEGEPYALDDTKLAAAMKEDIALGLTPMFVSANVGSTNTCAVDPVRAIGEACNSCAHGQPGTNEKGTGLVPWLHVDAAYAGSAAICPENRWILDGIEAADSYLFNMHKWLLVNFDCTTMWVKRSAYLVDALSVTPEILKSEEYRRGQVSDFRDWQVPLGRKFRSLKLWLTMRAYGLDKVRGLIRRHKVLAANFEALVLKDDRFEIVAPPRFGLVCFRLKSSDADNVELRSRIISSGLSFFSSTKLGGRTCLRMCVGTPSTEARHVRELWDAIDRTATALAAEGG